MPNVITEERRQKIKKAVIDSTIRAVEKYMASLDNSDSRGYYDHIKGDFDFVDEFWETVLTFINKVW
jgi:DNA-binding protein Fis